VVRGDDFFDGVRWLLPRASGLLQLAVVRHIRFLRVVEDGY
jgi:hypothetical protein